QRRIVRWNERGAAHHPVAAGVKKIEKALAYFVTSHSSPSWNGIILLYRGAAGKRARRLARWPAAPASLLHRYPPQDRKFQTPPRGHDELLSLCRGRSDAACCRPAERRRNGSAWLRIN